MMPEPGGSVSRLNEYQGRHLRVTCEYVDKLLCEIEAILNSSASKAAFPKYVARLSPAARQAIEDYVAQIRAQLLRILDSQGVPRQEPSIPDVRAIYVNLSSIDIALDELQSKHMRGYGAVPENVAWYLDGVVEEVQGLVSQVCRYLLSRTVSLADENASPPRAPDESGRGST